MDQTIKRIGILTFSRACNYGAFLQAYALQKTLGEFEGIEANIINYVSKGIEQRYKPWIMISKKRSVIKTLCKTILQIKDLIARNNVFEQSRQKYYEGLNKPLSREELKGINNIYDAFIVGSDQVWNRKITGGDSSFFLNFVEDNKKKYSYAASTGEVDLTKEEIQFLIENISCFSRVSVREVGTKAILEDNGIKSNVCLDPVFLLSRKQWIEFSQKVKLRQPYVLFFQMGQKKDVMKAYQFAKEYAKKQSLDLIYLSDNNLWYRYRDALHYGTASPEEFVGLINAAECIVTNSFHATAFSIILHKDFYVETHIARNDRVLDLLNIIELNERGLVDGVTRKSPKLIDWSIVDDRIEKAKAESKKYLYEVCKDVYSRTC